MNEMLWLAAVAAPAGAADHISLLDCAALLMDNIHCIPFFVSLSTSLSLSPVSTRNTRAMTKAFFAVFIYVCLHCVCTDL